MVSAFDCLLCEYRFENCEHCSVYKSRMLELLNLKEKCKDDLATFVEVASGVELSDTEKQKLREYQKHPREITVIKRR